MFSMDGSSKPGVGGLDWLLVVIALVENNTDKIILYGINCFCFFDD
jgi:hypothetical protein